METSPSISNIAAALSKTQAAISNAVKDAQGYGYKFADLAQILELIRPFLGQHGLAVFQDSGTDDAGNMTMTTMVTHTSGEWMRTGVMSMPVEAKKGLSAAQCAGIVVTYMRRYQLSPLFGIAAEDSDGVVREDPKPGRRQPEPEPEPEPEHPPVEELVERVRAAGEDVTALRDAYAWAGRSGYPKRFLDRISEKARAVAADPPKGKFAALTNEQVATGIDACASTAELEEYRDHLESGGAAARHIERVNEEISDRASIDIAMHTLNNKQDGRRYYENLKDKGASKGVLDMVAAHCRTLPEDI